MSVPFTVTSTVSLVISSCEKPGVENANIIAAVDTNLPAIFIHRLRYVPIRTTQFKELCQPNEGPKLTLTLHPLTCLDGRCLLSAVQLGSS
jgi:hypothetical protein